MALYGVCSKGRVRWEGLHWACSERGRAVDGTGRLKAASMWETESEAGSL